MQEAAVEETLKMLILKAATSAWRDGEKVGAVLLFAIYCTLSNN